MTRHSVTLTGRSTDKVQRQLVVEASTPQAAVSAALAYAIDNWADIVVEDYTYDGEVVR